MKGGMRLGQRRLRSKPLFVKEEKRVEVIVQRVRIDAKSEPDHVTVAQPAIPSADLLAKVGRPPEQILVEPLPEADDGVSLDAQHAPAQLAAPGLVSRQVLADEHVPVPGRPVEQATNGSGDLPTVTRPADRT